MSLLVPASSDGRFVMFSVATVTPAAFLSQPVGTVEVVVPSHPARFTLSSVILFALKLAAPTVVETVPVSVPERAAPLLAA